MSYRSIKNVFGESNLERKILILACICLFLLIGTSFFWVNRITEQLIWKSTQRRAQSMYVLDQALIHLNSLYRPAKVDDSEKPIYEAADNLASDFKGRAFESEFLVLEPGTSRNYINPRVATDPRIVKKLQDLMPHALERRKELLKSISSKPCLLYTSPSPRDRQKSRMPSSA